MKRKKITKISLKRQKEILRQILDKYSRTPRETMEYIDKYFEVTYFKDEFGEWDIEVDRKRGIYV